MANDTVRDEDISTAEGERAAVPGSGSTQGSANAIPDETMTAQDVTEEEAARLKRRAAGNAVDDNAASHQGGIGAQSGQTDFGAAGNLQGYDRSDV